MNKTRKKSLAKLPVYVLLILLVFVINIPIINMVGVSLKSPQEVLTDNSLLPADPTFENYRTVWEKSNFAQYTANSFLVSVSVTVLTTLVTTLAGYAISRFRHQYRLLRSYRTLLLLLQMFPTVLMLIPLFSIFNNVGLANSHLSVILIYLTFSLPFCTWMMSAFFDGVPTELDEAGTIDGCTTLQCFFRIALPVSGPGIASVSIFTFIYCWNEYLLASVFLKREELKTLPVGIQVFIQQFNTEWNLLMTASVMAIVPVVIFLIFMQKYIVAGLTSGAVKG